MGGDAALHTELVISIKFYAPTSWMPKVHELILWTSITDRFQRKNAKDFQKCQILTVFPKPPSESLPGLGALPFVEQAHYSFRFRIQGERQELQGDWQRGRVLHHKVLHLGMGKGKSKSQERHSIVLRYSCKNHII